MKSIITKFITIGVMLLLVALIVSRYPKMSSPDKAQDAAKTTTVSKLTARLTTHELRTN